MVKFTNEQKALINSRFSVSKDENICLDCKHTFHDTHYYRKLSHLRNCEQQSEDTQNVINIVNSQDPTKNHEDGDAPNTQPIKKRRKGTAPDHSLIVQQQQQHQQLQQQQQQQQQQVQQQQVHVHQHQLQQVQHQQLQQQQQHQVQQQHQQHHQQHHQQQHHLANMGVPSLQQQQQQQQQQIVSLPQQVQQVQHVPVQHVPVHYPVQDTLTEQHAREITDALVTFFISASIPFGTVESNEFKEFLEAIKPAYATIVPSLADLERSYSGSN